MFNGFSKKSIIVLCTIFLLVALGVLAFLYFEDRNLSKNTAEKNLEQKTAAQLYEENVLQELKSLTPPPTPKTEVQVLKELDSLKPNIKSTSTYSNYQPKAKTEAEILKDLATLRAPVQTTNQ